ncbi:MULTISPECIES: ClpXP protease specificity-enhancing factor [Pseudoxanthomonas]|jgi:stringent starvation protein B|uniref:ClpXP protease specificity-enhancing factor n=1 Tax=Pseudoxanthomonas mexicana TaxID=128785 RepID=A0A7G9TC39_PSEMX|nr:ClpXP protease specificity-enhancing factor [Pseudoxanthomonas mexicana]MCP1583330.1 stringent starvation protein B [Pseudoxanthomonas mexicana]QNN77664.1 ClpXP protease specificity-enhancing factor [Pseudoxanthomonas mexicana]
MTDASSRMTSHRPYLLRALNEWIADNGMTPHLLVDATQAGVQVPASAVKEGKVVLNIAERAVVRLMIDNDAVSFTARFGGVSQPVYVPISAVLAIYSRETGQGMALPEDVTHDADTGEESGDDAPATDTPPDDHTPPPGGKRPPFLRVVK